MKSNWYVQNILVSRQLSILKGVMTAELNLGVFSFVCMDELPFEAGCEVT